MRLRPYRRVAVAYLQFIGEAEVNAGENGTRLVQLSHQLGQSGVLGASTGNRPRRAVVGPSWSALQGVDVRLVWRLVRPASRGHSALREGGIACD